MFTKNFYQALRAQANNSSIYYYQFTKTTNATERTSFSPFLGAYLGSIQTGYTNKGGVVFGEGTEPPTYEDYKLAGTPITGITATVTHNNKHDATELEYVYTITNGNSYAITIAEIGIVTSGYCLLERSLLDNPVTIPAGGIGQVTYRINLGNMV